MSARKFELTPKSYGNVTVSRVDRDGESVLQVLLHGNLIVLINETKKVFYLDHCCWLTATTATAMNTALKQFRPDVSVFRKKGEMFISFANGEEVGSLQPKTYYGYGN